MKRWIPKQAAFVLVALIVLREWKSGYFKALPGFFSRFDWKAFCAGVALLGGLAGCLFFVDAALLSVVQSLQDSRIEDVILFGGAIGRGTNPWIFLVGWYGLGVWLSRPRWTQAAFGCMASSGLTALTCAVFKIIFLRARPDAGLGPFSFWNPAGLSGDHRSFQSFPSGDVAVVAGTAAFLFFFARRGPARWLVFVFPVLTALSRIDLIRHWPSDTVFSLGLGVLFGRMMWAYGIRREASSLEGGPK